jgi:ribonucleoside-diphosphate reductase alpha chain
MARKDTKSGAPGTRDNAGSRESAGSGETAGSRETAGSSVRAIRPGVTVPRRFTHPGAHPYDGVTWELRTASLTNEKAEVLFEQQGVETPAAWSQMATNVVASKYFNGAVGTPERERSVKQLVSRVVGTIARWGREQQIFDTPADADAFEAELTHMMVHQMAAFNSPVWFNVGTEDKPQCSACFINSVRDTMNSILDLAKIEGMLFKWGSGSGTNLSPLRSSKEALSGGGTASGPVSFMKGYDAFAGVIKSGGKTRRAAKMVILNIDHPDIMEYIGCKAEEEKKAWALIDAGYDGSLTGPAYASVFFQNSNNSVRVPDAFMEAVEKDGPWQTRSVRGGEPVNTYRARDVFRAMAEAAWICGDPGIQYHTTINDWHTCPNTGAINASNPCSEYMFLDDTACNLSSLNLMKFRTATGELDIEAFRHAVHIMVLAQEVIVDAASYPTPTIERNSHDYRPLGLGYANLGSVLMARGIPYDSEQGRHTAGAITALMTGQAYATSAAIAACVGPFPGFPPNREPMLKIIAKHRHAVDRIDPGLVSERLLAAARQAWERAEELGRAHGFRNAQTTVLAPTGTIAFMMDCDTTGVEPDIALIKYKKLVGGGMLKMVNHTVPEALEYLGYSTEERQAILDHLEAQDTIEGAPGLKPEHLPVFDCAFQPRNGIRTIHYMGHIRMMSAVQPFLSGAISKTVNMPREATVEDIERVCLEAWKLGLKAVAIYRDGCKRTQPLNTGRENRAEPPVAVAAAAASPAPASEAEPAAVAAPWPVRRRLPNERQSITHKFSIGGHEGYVTVGLYPDSTPGEIFIVMAKEGSVISGMVDSFATAVSLALQYGVPLRVLVDKFVNVRFEPSGITANPEIRFAKSVTDYVFRWLALKFIPDHPVLAEGRRRAPEQPGDELRAALGGSPAGDSPTGVRHTHEMMTDAPSCPDCGALMVRNAACYRCFNCGTTNGCS